MIMRILLAIALLAAAGCDFSQCPACGGKGRNPCTLCVKGRQDCGVCVGGSTDAGRPCAFCKGAGTIVCQACRGECSTVCDYCKGKGRR